MTWIDESLAFLAAAQRPDGGWSYFSTGDSAIEPTATCMAALLAHGGDRDKFERGRSFIASLQGADGAIRPQVSQPDPTTLAAYAGAVVAFHMPGDPLPERVADYLLGYEPLTSPRNPVLADDSTLRGFGWRPVTYSWVEPTAYALFLLYRLGRQTPRIAEARRVLLDRAVPNAGWNYGNSVVFGTPLESAPMPTALALMALYDDSTSRQVKSGVNYLQERATDTPSALSFAWLVMALRARGLDRDAAGNETWSVRLGQLFDRSPRSAGSPWHRAAALLAAAPLNKNPFVFGAAP